LSAGDVVTLLRLGLAATLIPADCINRHKLSELLLADLVADYEENGLNGLAAIQTAPRPIWDMGALSMRAISQARKIS